jgi:hypothetical protein
MSEYGKLTKVTRNQVRAALRRMPKSETMNLWICPCKTRPNPGHPFNMAQRIGINWEGFRMDTTEAYRNEDTLDVFVNRFTAYNCTNETGRYVHYYIEEMEENKL